MTRIILFIICYSKPAFGQRKLKDGALFPFLNANGSALFLKDFPGQVKSYPAPLLLPDLQRSPAVKALEYMGILTCGNADPFILHLYKNVAHHRYHPYFDMAAGRRIFNRIVQQVNQGFLGPFGIMGKHEVRKVVQFYGYLFPERFM